MMSVLYPNDPVMIVDDEESALQSCQLALRSNGINNLILLKDSREVIPTLEKIEICVILLDLSMPHITGKELLKLIKTDYPYLPVIIITGANDVYTAVSCMQEGAFDYMVKPIEKNRLLSGVKRAVEMRELQNENKLLRESLLSREINNPEIFSEIITQNIKMKSVFLYVEDIAITKQPILITGETGVGKELLARAIYKAGHCKGEFVAVNVAGLDDTIFADTLFGHRRGAFTGAAESRKGLIEQANEGILFLDEIGDLSTSSQIKLLRLIQENEYYPIGSDLPKKANTRIIVSTNQDLQSLLNNNTFRKDLYYRLKTHHIHIPPLRERKDDIPLLVNFFIEESAKAIGKKIPTYPKELLTIFSNYNFPGNIRELKSLIFNAVSKHKQKILSLDTIIQSIYGEDKKGTLTSIKESYSTLKNNIEFPEELPTIKEITAMLIEEALSRAKGNQSIAARLLGITQQALSKRLKNIKEE